MELHFLIVSTLFFFSFTLTSAQVNGLKTYIVHVKKPESTIFAAAQDVESWYQSFLPVSIASLNEPKRMVYSYHHVMSGFAARLTEEEVKDMQEKDGFVLAHPERILQLHTTHTPNFLGLYPETGFWKGSNYGKGVIVGVVDGGVYPSHPSFNDEGMPPPPSKWKGRCDFNAADCNNKLIGARSFLNGDPAVPGGTGDAPIDDKGHGTHTASTAAGAFVKGANLLGNANGTASGMAPYAHLAIYKACSKTTGCLDSAILAAMDAAVEDGVDVLSVSLGGPSTPFYMDSISIAAFGAIQKGIFVSCSAGNDGPVKGSVKNEAPWVLTVGSSTVDRSIRATAKLGNGEEFDGESLFQPKDFLSPLLPLVYPGASGNPKSAFCRKESFDGIDVVGKVVLCQRGGKSGRIKKGLRVKQAGGAAMILMNDEENGYRTSLDAHVLPATHVSYADGLKIMAYINSSPTPTATILFKGTVIGNSLAPQISLTSSRGPSIATPGILKPDIVGPGVKILAAWPFLLDTTTTSTLTFNIISGTSMACPHLSGIAALLKSSHPDWSPAAIKSAIMTTAYLHNLEGKPMTDQAFNPADVFATGSGHVNPSRANNPGLVYDIQPDDYIPYLCGLGYTDDQVTVITRHTIKCSNQTSIAEGALNYPSFSVKLGSLQTFTRTLTNVGEANSSYELEIVAPQGVDVSVQPGTLYFSDTNQKLTYTTTFTRIASNGSATSAQGFLSWVSPIHFVRSPISVTFE